MRSRGRRARPDGPSHPARRDREPDALMGDNHLLKKFLLAALLCLGFAAFSPQATNAAPMGPAVTFSGDVAPAAVEKAQWRRRRWGRRGYYGRRFYRPRVYRRGFYGRRFYGPRRFYRPRYARRRFY